MMTDQQQMEAAIERLIAASTSRDLRKGLDPLSSHPSDKAFEDLHRAIGGAVFMMRKAAKTEPAPKPETTETKCTECGGSNVQIAMWVRPNTGEILDMPSSDYDCARLAGLAYCDDCEEHTTLTDNPSPRFNKPSGYNYCGCRDCSADVMDHDLCSYCAEAGCNIEGGEDCKQSPHAPACDLDDDCAGDCMEQG